MLDISLTGLPSTERNSCAVCHIGYSRLSPVPTSRSSSQARAHSSCAVPSERCSWQKLFTTSEIQVFLALPLPRRKISRRSPSAPIFCQAFTNGCSSKGRLLKNGVSHCLTLFLPSIRGVDSRWLRYVLDLRSLNRSL
jgi:hypothetical protein